METEMIDARLKLPWITRFLLAFKRMKWKEATDGPVTWKVGIKMLFGKAYIFKVFEVPPHHVNCRCMNLLIMEE